MKETKQLKKAVEKKFLKIRGWKDWEEYDKIIESSQLDKNVRSELISICIKQTLKDVCEEIKKIGREWEVAEESGSISGEFNYIQFKESAIFKELLKKFQGEKE